MDIITMKEVDLSCKRVLIRVDLNVPIKEGVILSDSRIRAVLPTIECALKQNAAVMLASHLGRPIEGEYNSKFSLQPIAEYLKQNIYKEQYPVRFVIDYLNGVNIECGEIVVLENVRFNKGEKKDDITLAKKYAALCDVFVMDAFGTAHRAHASTHAISKFASVACAGPLFCNELLALSKALNNPDRPMVAIVGGSKVSTKLSVLDSLSKIVDYLIIGGGIANTFIAAQGYKVGKSIYEAELIPTAKQLLENCDIPIPTDVVVAKEFSENAHATMKCVGNIQDDDLILDLGESSISCILDILNTAKTIIWNGPLGVFEFPNFSQGTIKVAKAVANNNAFSIVGGGDTIMAIELFGLGDSISYMSTGGGAFLEFIEGKTLPSLSVLQSRMNN